MTPTSFLRILLVGAALAFGAVCSAQDSKFDEPPTPTKTVAPVYPSILRHDGISGMVTMSIVVDETGAVQDAVVKKSTRPEFEQPAIDAVLRWRFKPAKKDGKPVSVQVVVPVKFSVN